MSEFQLYADEFTEADQENLGGFSCGESISGRLCTQWITGSDVLESIKRGSMVWLFRNITNQIIGFGSVGPINWRWPLPNGNYTRLLYIPMLGIDQRYQGQPPDREWRYSHQIMQHLKFAAHQMNADLKTPSEWLLLLVAPDNAGAIHLYEQFDFQLLPDVTRGPGLRVMKHHLAE